MIKKFKKHKIHIKINFYLIFKFIIVNIEIRITKQIKLNVTTKLNDFLRRTVTHFL